MPPMPPRHNAKAPAVEVHDIQRGNATDRGYDYRWQKASRRYRMNHPLCVVCKGEGRVEPAAVVDHIIPHRGRQTLFWNTANWQSLCKRCHDQKTARERRLQIV